MPPFDATIALAPRHYVWADRHRAIVAVRAAVQAIPGAGRGSATRGLITANWKCTWMEPAIRDFPVWDFVRQVFYVYGRYRADWECRFGSTDSLK